MSLLIIEVMRRKIIEIHLRSGGRFKHVNKSYDNIFGIGIPDLVMNLMSCHIF